jgi:hypothetical protein
MGKNIRKPPDLVTSEFILNTYLKYTSVVLIRLIPACQRGAHGAGSPALARWEDTQILNTQEYAFEEGCAHFNLFLLLMRDNREIQDIPPQNVCSAVLISLKTV